MAGGFPVGFQWSHADVNASTGSAISVTPGASANAVGSYAELISSTARASTWALVQIQHSGLSTAFVTSSTNIATGASGSESVIVADLRMQQDSLSSLPGQCSNYFFPLVIPAGTRVSANAQASGASAAALRVSIQLFDDAFGSIIGGGGIDTIGFDSSTTLGTSIDPGTTASTKGDWVEISSSLDHSVAGFFLGFDAAITSSGGTFNAGWTIDVGVGANGSEVVILPDFQIYSRSLTNSKPLYPPNTPFFPIQIPAGTRVAVRAQFSASTANNARLIGVTFYGVRL